MGYGCCGGCLSLDLTGIVVAVDKGLGLLVGRKGFVARGAKAFDLRFGCLPVCVDARYVSTSDSVELLSLGF